MLAPSDPAISHTSARFLLPGRPWPCRWAWLPGLAPASSARPSGLYDSLWSWRAWVEGNRRRPPQFDPSERRMGMKAPDRGLTTRRRHLHSAGATPFLQRGETVGQASAARASAADRLSIRLVATALGTIELTAAWQLSVSQLNAIDVLAVRLFLKASRKAPPSSGTCWPSVWWEGLVLRTRLDLQAWRRAALGSRQ